MDTPPTPTPPPTPDVPPAYIPDEAECKRAFAAFKKRIKALQLETDSKLGRSHVTGPKETVTAIQPPLGFGKVVWEHLAKIGWIKYEGRGFYQILKKD
jgi:hypothetical protein